MVYDRLKVCIGGGICIAVVYDGIGTYRYRGL